MQYYSAQDLARSFRTVRNNTIKIAEEIPEESYARRMQPNPRTDNSSPVFGAFL